MQNKRAAQQARGAGGRNARNGRTRSPDAYLQQLDAAWPSDRNPAEVTRQQELAVGRVVLHAALKPVQLRVSRALQDAGYHVAAMAQQPGLPYAAQSRVADKRAVGRINPEYRHVRQIHEALLSQEPELPGSRQDVLRLAGPFHLTTHEKCALRTEGWQMMVRLVLPPHEVIDAERQAVVDMIGPAAIADRLPQSKQTGESTAASIPLLYVDLERRTEDLPDLEEAGIRLPSGLSLGPVNLYNYSMRQV